MHQKTSGARHAGPPQVQDFIASRSAERRKASRRQCLVRLGRRPQVYVRAKQRPVRRQGHVPANDPGACFVSVGAEHALVSALMIELLTTAEMAEADRLTV